VSEQTFNIARNALLTAGYAIETPGVTIDRQCGSSQQAAHFAAALIASGAMIFWRSAVLKACRAYH